MLVWPGRGSGLQKHPGCTQGPMERGDGNRNAISFIPPLLGLDIVHRPQSSAVSICAEHRGLSWNSAPQCSAAEAAGWFLNLMLRNVQPITSPFWALKDKTPGHKLLPPLRQSIYLPTYSLHGTHASVETQPRLLVDVACDCLARDRTHPPWTAPQSPASKCLTSFHANHHHPRIDYPPLHDIPPTTHTLQAQEAERSHCAPSHLPTEGL